MMKLNSYQISRISTKNRNVTNMEKKHKIKEGEKKVQKKIAAIETMAAIRTGTNKVTPAFSIAGEGAGASAPAANTPTFPKATIIIMQIVKTIENFLEPSISSSFQFKGL